MFERHAASSQLEGPVECGYDTDEQGMRIQKTRRNDIILARKFYDVVSDTVKLCSRSLSQSQPITHS